MQPLQSSGQRVKLARSLIGLTRKELEVRFNISVNTLQAWESDKINLTSKGAKKLSTAFVKLGLLCSEEWLISGHGNNPLLLLNNPDLPDQMNEDIYILREIEAFKMINPKPIVVMISDNGMEPIYSIGDYVGGNTKTDEQIQPLIGENCIIETLQGDTFVRKLLRGNKPHLYNLSCVNIGSNQQPFISDIKIKFAARIVLHRKREI